MKIIAFNGSPRKNWNTAELLNKTLEGAESKGAQTDLIHLYDLNYKGCNSCFACKLMGGKSYGKCCIEDDLKPVLSRVEVVDAIVIGSPNYFGAPSASTKAFLERLIFPYLSYDSSKTSLFKKKISSAFIYDMGSTDTWMLQMGYDQIVRLTIGLMKLIFGKAELLIVNDTYQFDDYSKYVSTRFDEKAKAKHREQQFPLDCKKAFLLGERLVTR